MKPVRALLVLVVLALSPATAFAQAAPTHWSAVYAGPILVAAALVLFGIGRALAVPGWNRIGVVLWMSIMTAGGCLAIYALPGIVQGKEWQLPALLLTFVLFIGFGQDTLGRLQRS